MSLQAAKMLLLLAKKQMEDVSLDYSADLISGLDDLISDTDAAIERQEEGEGERLRKIARDQGVG